MEKERGGPDCGLFWGWKKVKSICAKDEKRGGNRRQNSEGTRTVFNEEKGKGANRRSKRERKKTVIDDQSDKKTPSLMKRYVRIKAIMPGRNEYFDNAHRATGRPGGSSSGGLPVPRSESSFIVLSTWSL